MRFVAIAFCVILSKKVWFIYLFWAYVSLSNILLQSIVGNSTTLSSDPKKMITYGECSRDTNIPRSAKLEKAVSSIECLDSGLIPMVCASCLILSTNVWSVYLFWTYVWLLTLLLQNVVDNDTTLLSDPKKMTASSEHSSGIHIPRLMKVEKDVSSVECLDSDPTLMVCQIYFWK